MFVCRLEDLSDAIRRATMKTMSGNSQNSSHHIRDLDTFAENFFPR